MNIQNFTQNFPALWKKRPEKFPITNNFVHFTPTTWQYRVSPTRHNNILSFETLKFIQISTLPPLTYRNIQLQQTKLQLSAFSANCIQNFSERIHCFTWPLEKKIYLTFQSFFNRQEIATMANGHSSVKWDKMYCWSAQESNKVQGLVASTCVKLKRWGLW